MGTAENDAFTKLIQGRIRIVHSKLEVMAAEINERLRIRKEILHRVDSDKNVVHKLMRQMAYRGAEQRDELGLHGKILDLQEEERKEDVESWRDIVMVMRDFLLVWEEYEKAKNRGSFLSHV